VLDVVTASMYSPKRKMLLAQLHFKTIAYMCHMPGTCACLIFLHHQAVTSTNTQSLIFLLLNTGLTYVDLIVLSLLLYHTHIVVDTFVM
jgi:hypothetical protein